MKSGKKVRRILLVFCTLHLTLYTLDVVYGEQRDRFVFTQVKYAGEWDPYPEVYREVLRFLHLTTSAKIYSERRVVSLTDRLLFLSPFLILLGKSEFTPFSKEEVKNLRLFLENGGTLFIDDVSGQKGVGFDRTIRQELLRILPEGEWVKIPQNHAIFRSFYLLRTIGGRRIVNNYLEGINLDGRTVVIYSQNDLFGAWLRDRIGNYFYTCLPGGEQQRAEAIKLTANIILYGLTGTYKTDYIHRPFIEEKLRRR